MTTAFRKLTRKVALAAAIVAIAAPASSETQVGSTVESRVLLGFKADDAAVGAMLPEGWTPVTLPKGPVGGANLIVALIDRHVILDADGKPDTPSSGPIVAFLAYGRTEGVDGVRGFVTRVYEEPPVVDPYGNSVAADVDRVAGFSDPGGGTRTQSEKWTVRPDGGGELAVTLEFDIGGFRWAAGGESRPYSSENPDFFRIYRYDQLGGLAMNRAMGLDLDGTVSFSATEPDLAALFGGTEELVAVVSIPTYIRRISLP